MVGDIENPRLNNIAAREFSKWKTMLELATQTHGVQFSVTKPEAKPDDDAKAEAMQADDKPDDDIPF